MFDGDDAGLVVGETPIGIEVRIARAVEVLDVGRGEIRRARLGCAGQGHEDAARAKREQGRVAMN